MRRTWTPLGMACLFGAIAGIPIGLFMVLTLPFAWMYGAFILVISIGYLIYAFASKETTPEEHEKPLMDVKTEFDYEDKDDGKTEDDEHVR